MVIAIVVMAANIYGWNGMANSIKTTKEVTSTAISVEGEMLLWKKLSLMLLMLIII